MGNPLDDALRSLDESIELAAKHRAQRQAEHEVRRRRFHDLVTEFLARMGAMGNPLTDIEIRESRFRTVRAWTLIYDNRNKPMHLALTVDGRVYVGRTKQNKYGLVPYTNEHGIRDDQQFDLLEQSMASRIRNAELSSR
jgi:hypothetical protein